MYFFQVFLLLTLKNSLLAGFFLKLSKNFEPKLLNGVEQVISK